MANLDPFCDVIADKTKRKRILLKKYSIEILQGCTLKRIMLCQIKFGLLFKISNYHSKLLRVHVSSVYIWQYIFTAFSTARVHFKSHSTKSNLSTCVDMHFDPNECKVMFYHRVQGLYGCTCSNIISIYYQIFSSKHSSSYAMIR